MGKGVGAIYKLPVVRITTRLVVDLDCVMDTRRTPKSIGDSFLESVYATMVKTSMALRPSALLA